MPDRPNLTVNDVRALVEAKGRRWAVVIAEHEGGTQFVTWGLEAGDKVFASELSHHIATQLCPGPETVFEDFKMDAAKNKALLEQVVEQFKRFIHETSGGTQPCGQNVLDDARAIIAKVEGASP